MNKLFYKVAALSVGLAMAIGVGVGLGGQKPPVRAKAADVVDTLVASSFEATNTTYKDFSGVSFTSDAVYAGNSAKTSSGGIQLRSKNSNSGIVTTASGGTLKSISITVESGSATVDVYAKTTAYSAASDLYDSSTQGTKIGSSNTTGAISLTNPGNYTFVGIRSNNGALYLTSIEITWETSGSSLQNRQITFTHNSQTVSEATVELGTSSNTTYSITGISESGVSIDSSTPTIASISGTTITAVAYGTTTVVISKPDDSTYHYLSATITVNVNAPRPALITGQDLSDLFDDNNGNGKQLYEITGIVSAWKEGTDGTQFGNFYLQEEGDTEHSYLIYGATATDTSLTWSGTQAKFVFTNPKDFLTDTLTSDITIGDTLTMQLTRCDYTPSGGTTTKEACGIVTDVEKGDYAVTNFTINGSSSTTVSIDGVTVTFAKASGGNAPIFDNEYGVRLYANNTITITCSSGITAMSFNWTKNPSKAFASVTADVGTYTHPSGAGTGSWTGNATTIVLTVGSSGQIQLGTFSVTHVSVSIVYATGISIDQSTSSLNVAGTLNLSATLTPASPTDSSVTWSSSNSDILRVSSSGVVTAVGEGTATITVNANGAETPNSVQDTLSITTSVDSNYDYADIINPTLAGVTVNTHTAWGSVSATNSSHSSAEFSGKTNYSSANDMGINDTNGNGIIVSTSGGLAKKVVVVWNENTTSGRTLNIYGSDSALTLAGLSSATESLVYGTSSETTLNNGDGYRYIGFNSNNGALYVKTIIIYWDDDSSASLDLSGNTSASVGDTVIYTATRHNSSATIDWYVGETKQTTGIVVSGDVSTFSYSASAAGSFVIKAQLNGTEIAQTKTLTVSSAEAYTLVTSLDQLTVGNKVLLVGSNTVDEETKYYAAKSYASGNNVPSVEVNISGTTIAKNAASEFAAMTLGAASDGYTLLDENNMYLYASSTTANRLQGQASAGNNAYWTISLSESVFSIQATNNSSRGTMRFNYNNGTPIFNCYADDSSGADFNLYVLETSPSSADKLNTYGKLFLHSVDIPLVTEETGIPGTDCVDNGYYLAAKAALAGVWSSVSTSLQSDTTGLRLRYEAWARASGDAAPYDGNSTIQSSIRSQLALVFKSEDNTTLLIVISSVLAVAAVGGYFFLRRKKEQ